MPWDSNIYICEHLFESVTHLRDKRFCRVQYIAQLNRQFEMHYVFKWIKPKPFSFRSLCSFLFQVPSSERAGGACLPSAHTGSQFIVWLPGVQPLLLLERSCPSPGSGRAAVASCLPVCPVLISSLLLFLFLSHLETIRLRSCEGIFRLILLLSLTCNLEERPKITNTESGFVLVSGKNKYWTDWSSTW